VELAQSPHGSDKAPGSRSADSRPQTRSQRRHHRALKEKPPRTVQTAPNRFSPQPASAATAVTTSGRSSFGAHSKYCHNGGLPRSHNAARPPGASRRAVGAGKAPPRSPIGALVAPPDLA
jgi:hypothetical protein